MVANAATAIMCSRVGGDGELQERREEACAVCARKGWLEARFQCYLWKAFPHGNAGELAEERAEAEEEGEAVAEEASSASEGEETGRRRRLLRDVDGVYYVGDAAKAHKHLGVEHYAEAAGAAGEDEQQQQVPARCSSNVRFFQLQARFQHHRTAAGCSNRSSRRRQPRTALPRSSAGPDRRCRVRNAKKT